MGVDSNEKTAGFCSMGKILQFGYIEPNGTAHKLYGDIQPYAPNTVQMIGY